MLEKINIAVDKIDKQLKGFQSASVDYVLDQMYSKDRRKVLIADEVGLGKTIIAKGVIAKAIKSHKPSDRPFHVVYICSNQVLAQQNISKLNPIGRADKPLSRLVYLAYKDNTSEEAILKLSSLTPSTSFKLTNSVGTKEERAMLYSFLIQDVDIEAEKTSLYKLLQTKMIGDDSWAWWTKDRVERYDDLFRPEIASLLINHLKTVPASKVRFKKTYEYLGKESSSIYDAIKALIIALNMDEETNPMYFSYEIIRALRNELTQVCLAYLDADLFILDEFQRFKSLLDGDDNSESGEIAKVVLRNDAAHVLLLSATPFKPFTTQLEQLNGEDHHDEFRRLIEFLGGSKGKKLWKDFRVHQQAFFDILRHPIEAIRNPELAINKKENLEREFKKFLSRNERLSVAKEYHNMTKEHANGSVNVIEDDIKNFVALDQLVTKLETINNSSRNRFGSTMEFSKSAPYPLSFLHGYKLKEILDINRDNPEIKAHLKNNESAWIDYKQIDNYKPLGYHKNMPTYPNGKLRILANECFRDNGELLLWVPPSKPYYKPAGAYRKADDFSKILVFSGWAMAPRAIATLLSYEVERRTVANVKLKSNNDQTEGENYFSTPRKPAPLLVYKTTEKESGTTYQMSNFALTYPSISLSEISVIRDLDSFQYSYKELRKEQVVKLRDLFSQLDLVARFGQSSSREDKSWYWISGPLLDSVQNKDNKSIDIHLNLESTEEGSGFDKHMKNLKLILSQVIEGEKKLGRVPSDLFEVLADITLASPGVCSFTALKNNYGIEDEIEKQAFHIANWFCSMLNKPESITAIRLAVSKYKDFWRKTLKYCAEGNFLAMMEEYVYMLKNCNSIASTKETAELMQNVLSVRTSSIDVDLKNDDSSYETQKMRAHYAVAYGEQKMGTDAGSKRMINIRDVFNSPFRPFVLASTSVGQEGLDFHFYCRKIFHWNLPHNAIDLEQREGRINRFKGLVIRSKITDIVEDDMILDALSEDSSSIWSSIFESAKSLYKEDKSGIIPFWYLDEGKTNLERFVPIHKFSKDQRKYEQLKVTLALYRMTFGQPRQEELIYALKNSGLEDEDINKLRRVLLINLSAMNRY